MQSKICNIFRGWGVGEVHRRDRRHSSVSFNKQLPWLQWLQKLNRTKKSSEKMNCSSITTWCSLLWLLSCLYFVVIFVHNLLGTWLLQCFSEKKIWVVADPDNYKFWEHSTKILNQLKQQWQHQICVVLVGDLCITVRKTCFSFHTEMYMCFLSPKMALCLHKRLLHCLQLLTRKKKFAYICTNEFYSHQKQQKQEKNTFWHVNVI